MLLFQDSISGYSESEKEERLIMMKLLWHSNMSGHLLLYIRVYLTSLMVYSNIIYSTRCLFGRSKEKRLVVS